MKPKPRFPLGFVVTLLVLAAAGGVAFALQRERTAQLRADLAQAQAESVELARLQADNQRLMQKQISPADLARLREDHAAVVRLRAELDALEKSAPPAVR